MPSSKLVVALYRSLLRSAKVLDRHNAFKALLPREVEWHQGAKWRDFFGSSSSCVEAVRSEFRELRPKDEMDEALDEALQIHKTISQRVHLLYRDEDDRQLLKFAEVPHPTTFDEKYEWEKQQLSSEDAQALNGALELIQSAAQLLTSEELDMKDKTRLATAYYVESIKLYETADAHAYLGWHLYLDGKVEEAVTECQRAIQVDPAFGNPYNDLGLIRVEEGKKDEALDLFQKAKSASRNDVRHYACHNLAALHLEENRVKLALHEYIESLYWMRSDEPKRNMIRNTVTDMGNVLITLKSSKTTE
ncbi:Mitochondrial TOM complex subunit Tom70 [Phytophthora palmivora]|uniref:Mitochondrial TOM complex subunit Tom70 n=1 Tax=Phytophthora palmivora TaxID=4796 RepID=A0A2P4YEW3_9STRA|nr:Mitochondrial TOM complex subunit Tom70 [Phytophthora palmivora]